MFAESSNARLSFIEEVTWGTTPAEDFQRMRFKGTTLAATLDFTTSEEITPSASVTDVIPTGAGAGGDISYELSYGPELITLIEHAVRGTMDAFGIIKGSDDKKSLSVCKELVIDAVNSAFFLYQGARMNSWSVDLTVDGNTPIGGTFNLTAKGEEHSDADPTTASYDAANSNPVFSMPHLRGVAVTGIAGAVCFSDLSFTVENNLRAQNGKCTDTTVYPDLASKGIGYGQRNITGNVNAYLANLNIYDEYKTFGEFSLSFIMSDGVRAFKVTMPRIKITDGSAPAEGNDSDVLQPFTYQALYDTTEETDVIIEAIESIETDAGIKVTGVAPVPDWQGTFYDDGTLNDLKPVYKSVGYTAAEATEPSAIWWSTADSAWTITAYSDIGTFPTTGGWWENATAGAPTGAFSVGGTATGTLSGAAYNPLA